MGLKQIGLLRAKARARFIKSELVIFGEGFHIFVEDLVFLQPFSLGMFNQWIRGKNVKRDDGFSTCGSVILTTVLEKT